MITTGDNTYQNDRLHVSSVISEDSLRYHSVLVKLRSLLFIEESKNDLD